MQKTVIIAVPGEYCTSKVFEPLGQRLTSLGYIFVPTTLPDHEVGTKKSSGLSLKHFALSLADTIKKKRAEFPRAKIFLLGHSMGASVINTLYKNDSPVTREIVGVMFLSPLCGMSLRDALGLAWRYKQVVPHILFGIPHKPSFELLHKEMCNNTPPFDAREIYTQMLPESSSALRTACVDRKDYVLDVPRISIFGSNDKTITPRYTNSSVTVFGDHISMIQNTTHTIETFLKEHV